MQGALPICLKGKWGETSLHSVKPRECSVKPCPRWVRGETSRLSPLNDGGGGGNRERMAYLRSNMRRKPTVGVRMSAGRGTRRPKCNCLGLKEV